MTYFLYSKRLNPDIDTIVKKKINPYRYPSITPIARRIKGGVIKLTLVEFAKKYMPEHDEWVTYGTIKKRDLFKQYMHKHEADEETGNLFGVIAQDGIKWEPLDFLTHIEWDKAKLKGDI